MLLEHSTNPGYKTRIPPRRRENPPIRAEIPWNHRFRPERPPQGINEIRGLGNPVAIHGKITPGQYSNPL